MSARDRRLPPTSPLPLSAHRVLLAALASLLAVFSLESLLWPGGASGVDEPASWLYHFIALGTVALCGARAVTLRAERLAWAAVAAGMAAFCAADLFWTVSLAQLDDPPYPSLADAGYLSFAPAVYAGTILLLRARFGRLPASMWLDGLTAGLAVAAVGSALVFDAVLSASGGDALTVAVNLAYPVFDLALVTVVIGVLVVTGWKPGRTWAFLAAGLATFAVADSVYLVQVAAGSYDENTILDAGWLAGMVLLAIAAWQPPVRGRPEHLQDWPAVTGPIAAGVVTVGILVYDHFAQLPLLTVVFSGAALMFVLVRLILSFAANFALVRALRAQATTDALTGLHNRRSLLSDLEGLFADGERTSEAALAMFDLDGFKTYNDTFGHLGGDALLERLAARLGRAAEGYGRAYRVGGDEFCVLVPDVSAQTLGLFDEAATALSEHGERFSITASYGTVLLPEEAHDPIEALRIADGRMYTHKAGSRLSAAEQARDALLRALTERNGELGVHTDDVADLALRTAAALGLHEERREHTRLAAELHDIGKVAIPDAILNKPGPLDDEEWAFMRRHTIIGERILAAAPDLAPVAGLVRSTHERVDGTGYPDGKAGDAIPLEARIVAVADAYDAMTTDRPYRRAMAPEVAVDELRRCTGSQFDARVVQAFVGVVRSSPALPLAV